MSTKYESADLILKLYDLRREETMRKARIWWGGFNPDSVQDITNALMGENSAYYRMVSTYWEMAATLVNNGAIDETMFKEANGEHLFVFAKIAPYLEEIRGMVGMQVMMNLEKLVKRTEGAEELLEQMRQNSRKWAAARQQSAGEAEKARAGA
jgi:hypothetical protein